MERESFQSQNLFTRLIPWIPVLAAVFVFFSALAFTPVPWPDDSAFYFVAKGLFHWPPRWVMLPQAPFEPTYRIYNFNTMPLYPILIGLGRFIGIDGSHLLKLWPLSAWAASGALLVWALLKKGLPDLAALALALAVGFDPVMRWASVLVRPESLIGLFGVALVLGLTFGFPKKFKERRFWDPVAALLALGAYAHFNAVHLLFPVLAVYALQPRRLVRIGLHTLAYLTPWFITVIWHGSLFVHQMHTQWARLAVGNGWLSSIHNMIQSLLPSMGSPEDWPKWLEASSVTLWILMAAAVVAILSDILRKPKKLSLVPSAAWIAGSAWLWHNKPEVWFIYYIHLSIWCFVGIAMLRFWTIARPPKKNWAWIPASLLFLTTAASGASFVYLGVDQAIRLGETQSWHWSTYRTFIDCIDRELSRYEKSLGREPGAPFTVWDPTFPDITIELSRRHPNWELTRTNDFWERVPLALEHGNEVDVVVVPETINASEREIDAPADQNQNIQSVWMTWKDYFLNRLYTQPGWKPHRYLCQTGRWQGFIFEK